MMDLARGRGVSLLETILAIFILTLTLWSILTLYSTLMTAGEVSEARLAAVLEAESLVEYWERRARDEWPKGADGVAPPMTVEGESNDYLYRVELSGTLPDPRDEGDALDMQLLKVTVLYEDGEREAKITLARGVSR